MKKTIFAAAALLLMSAAAFAQDSTNVKKDTVRQEVPVFIQERTDTIQVPDLVYKGEKGVVKYCSPGWLIVRTRVATRDGKNYQPLAQPEIIGGLDDKRRKVDPIRTN